MKNIYYSLFFIAMLIVFGCNSYKPKPDFSPDKSFYNFKEQLLDAYWKNHPAGSIFAGYGKYYDILIVPDNVSLANTIEFTHNWLEALKTIDVSKLNDNNKVSLNIIKNQLESDSWYLTVFKQHEWDASMYNLAGECDYIINQPYAPLAERLKTLTKHLELSDRYYEAAFKRLKKPTKEHLELAILQNKGGLSVFGDALTDSIKISGLSDEEKEALKQNISKTTQAINNYITALKTLQTKSDKEFRDFRIGKKLFAEKFRYDLVTDFTPEKIYSMALADKKNYHAKMITVAHNLWDKYCDGQTKPKDSLKLIQKVLDKIQLQHAKPADFFDSLTSHVYRLKKFIIEKDLFDFDTIHPPVEVRIMPAYARGFSVASAEFTPPYQQTGTTYYNIDDLTLYTSEKAESVLKEYNNYSSQLLSIHEAIPGHCLQGIYNNKKSPDVVRSVFQNGAMIEGWAVYAEAMMLEQGWGNNSPEIELVHYKLKLRELANVIIDYELHCLNKSKEDLIHLMVDQCFQTKAQAEEKYHRATVSQVQLCSYYAGSTAVQSLRDEYRKKMGKEFNLKNFHETFLSFGSSPVKYIRERMLQ